MFFLRDSLTQSSSTLGGGGLLLKERICSPEEQILSYKSTHKFEVIQ